MKTFLYLYWLKLTAFQSLSMKHVLMMASLVPRWVSRMSFSDAMLLMVLSTEMHEFSFWMNGRTQNLWLLIVMSLNASMTVRCFLRMPRLLNSQECLRNMSWLPGKTIHFWSSLYVSSKKAAVCHRVSRSMAFLLWNRSPRTSTVSMLVFLQYSRMTRHAHIWSFILPLSPRWMSAVMTMFMESPYDSYFSSW